MAFTEYLVACVLIVFTYPVFCIVRNLYLHPLSRIPGPATWAASPLPFLSALIKGTVVRDVGAMHRKYGPVLRISPNEVTFAGPHALNDIFARGFAKDQLWWRKQPNRPDSLISAANEEDHLRMRKLLAQGFTTKALRAQEPIVQRYVSLLVDRLHEQAITQQAGFDLVPWLNFTAFDIFGDLGFGESFDCLQHSRYHPWIWLLFNSVKAASFVIAARYFPLLDSLLQMAIPKSLREMADAHYQQIVEKVDRRLNWELERPDLMSHVIGQNQQDGLKGMSRDEINITFMILTTAGSETTATCLSGIFTYLLLNRDKMDELVKETRQASADGTFSLATLDRLSYLTAVIQEGLRLYPPIPVIFPWCVPKEGALVCDTWLPGGTSVSLQTWSLFRDPQYFHRASEFLPERWLPGAALPSSPFYKDERDSVQPFIVGPHSCLGRHLAWAEMRLILG